jgi:hypothetical protein
MTDTKSPAERQANDLTSLRQAVEALASLLAQPGFSLPDANQTFCEHLVHVRTISRDLFGGPPPRVIGQIETIPTGSSQQLVELQNEVNRLRQLLTDPQPGLGSWTTFLFIRAYNVEAIGVEMLGGQAAAADLRRELKS